MYTLKGENHCNGWRKLSTLEYAYCMSIRRTKRPRRRDIFPAFETILDADVLSSSLPPLWFVILLEFDASDVVKVYTDGFLVH